MVHVFQFALARSQAVSDSSHRFFLWEAMPIAQQELLSQEYDKSPSRLMTVCSYQTRAKKNTYRLPVLTGFLFLFAAVW